MSDTKPLPTFKKPKQFDTNLVVIGAGSAGLVSSYIAATVKAKVTLIEKEKMGGDCLNTGCVPSKALIRSAKMAHYFKQAAAYGLKNAQAEVDFPQVMERIQNIIKKIEPHDSIERYQSLGVDCEQGAARIVSPYQVEVNGKVITTRNIIIASGAKAFVPPIKGLDKIDYLTSDNVWSIREQPKRLLVMGGGPIGCELAQSFNRLGSQVTQIDMADRIMPREDPDISDYMRTRFEAEGVKVLTSHKAIEMLQENGENILIAEYQGQQKRIVFDRVMLAVGRRANTQGLGLDDLGIETTPQGTIAVDEYLRTHAYKNIFACGDVAGPYQFTHTASHQAWYATVNALFGSVKKFKVNYSVIPWATFTDPEVGRVGLNEQDAKQQNIPYELTRYGIDDLDRAIADEQAHGFVKVLTVPGKDKILGANVVGHNGGELVQEFVMAMQHNLGLKNIMGTIHIYPTQLEANKFAAGQWSKAHAPQKLLAFAKWFHSLKRG